MFRLSASAAFLSAVLAVLSLATEIEAQTPANLCHPVITGEKIVATPGQRLAAGEQAQPPGIVGPSGFDWSDTQLGIVRSRDGANYLFFGSDGSCHANCGKFDERDGSITRTVGSFDDPLGADPPIETILPQSIQFQNNAIVYAGGGLVTRVPSGHPGAGNLLMVYGAARWTDLLGQNGNYGLTGLAKSYDDGVTWTDLGFIITANVPFIPGAPPNINEYDSGLGNLIPIPPASSTIITSLTKSSAVAATTAQTPSSPLRAYPSTIFFTRLSIRRAQARCPRSKNIMQGILTSPGWGAFPPAS